MIRADGNAVCPYEVGDILYTVNTTAPSTRWAGTTWQQIKDTFLLGAGDTYALNSTGGEAEHTLTVNEMPSHTHEILGGGSTLSLVTGSARYRLSFATNGGAVQMVNSNTGGGQAHNNMPPYRTVYIWLRTA